MKQIQIKCKTKDYLPIDTIFAFQGKLKKISKSALSALKRRIVEDGFIAPLFVWYTGNEHKILDGHQRLQCLLALREEGYTIPNVPVVFIEAENEAEAKERLLSITSSYADFNTRELESWLSEVDASIQETLRFSNGEIEVALKLTDEQINQDETKSDLKPFNKVIVQFVMTQDTFFEIKDMLQEIAEVSGVEYEQGSS